MAMSSQTQKQLDQQLQRMVVHPSGPELKGHPRCQPGHIFSHKLGRCISLMEYRKMQEGGDGAAYV